MGPKATKATKKQAVQRFKIPQGRKQTREERMVINANRVPEQKKQRLSNPQPSLALVQEKELFNNFYQLIQVDKTTENICMLQPNQYYTNLFILCCGDGLHDTRLPRSDTADAKQRQESGYQFFKKVGVAILTEYLQYLQTKPDKPNLKTEPINPIFPSVTYAKFFENVCKNPNAQFNTTLEPTDDTKFRDIEDYILNMLVQNDDESNKLGRSRKLYDFCKNLKEKKEERNQVRFCDQNGFWKGESTWGDIATEIHGNKTEYKTLKEIITSVPATFSNKNCFLNIDMGVTSTLIDGLRGKVTNLTNVWNNSYASAPGIAVEFGNMNIRFQMDGDGNNNNYLKFTSEYVIVDKSTGTEYTGDDFMSSGSELISTKYKILLKVMVTRNTWKTEATNATYVYELYPELMKITINEELIEGNRNNDFEQGGITINQQNNLGSYAKEYAAIDLPEVSPEYDFTFTIRKALCDYFQSLQTCVKYGGNSVPSNQVDDCVKYFPEENTIIKYKNAPADIAQPPQAINPGDQLRMSVHNDRPAVAIAYYLIANTQTTTPNQGMNACAHTSSCFEGTNFFISNNQGCVISLLYVGNSVIKFKKNQQGGGPESEMDVEPPTESQVTQSQPGVEPNELEPFVEPTDDGIQMDQPFDDTESDIIRLFTDRDSDAANLETINKILNFKCSEEDLIKLHDDNLKICNFLYGIKDNPGTSSEVSEDLKYIKIDRLGLIIVPYVPDTPSDIIPPTPDDDEDRDDEIKNVFPNLFDNLSFFKKDEGNEYYTYGKGLDISYTTSEVPKDEADVMLENMVRVIDLWSLNSEEVPAESTSTVDTEPMIADETDNESVSTIIEPQPRAIFKDGSSKRQRDFDGGKNTKKNRKVKRKKNTIKKNKKYSKKTIKHKKRKHKKRSIKH